MAERKVAERKTVTITRDLNIAGNAEMNVRFPQVQFRVDEVVVKNVSAANNGGLSELISVYSTLINDVLFSFCVPDGGTSQAYDLRHTINRHVDGEYLIKVRDETNGSDFNGNVQLSFQLEFIKYT